MERIREVLRRRMIAERHDTRGTMTHDAYLIYQGDEYL
jgi:hypothetical protein